MVTDLYEAAKAYLEAETDRRTAMKGNLSSISWKMDSLYWALRKAVRDYEAQRQSISEASVGAFRKDAPATSRRAAIESAPRTGTQRWRVYQAISWAGEKGMTDDEIESMTGMRHQTASARRWELVRGGFVRDSGERRPTRGGALAICWVKV